MILRLLRLAILLEVLFSCCTSYHSPFSSSGDYQSIKDVLRFAKNDPSLISHARVIAQDFTSQNNIQNIKDAMCCVSIFKLADDTSSAMKVIENMESRNLKVDTFLYNNVISVCSKTSDWRLAIDLLLIMQSRGVSSDTISFSSAISACAKAGRWRESLNLLNEMTIAGIAADTICFSSAISACAAAGCWKEALLLLSNMKSKKVPLDTIVCNSAISACVPCGEWTVALRLMDLMRTEGLILNAYTYAAAMSACDTAGECDQSINLLELMLTFMAPVLPPLTSSYSQDRDSCDPAPSPATAALDIRTATVPFNVAIAATTKCGRISKAKELFLRMGTLGVPRNTVTYTTLIVGITKSKNFDQRLLLDVHQMMVDARLKRNAAIFGAVIAAAEKIDDCILTLSLLEQMKAEGITTTSFVYHSAISACGKAGRLEKSVDLLREMKDRKVERTTVTYSLLMNACKRSGEWEKALLFLSDMELDLNEGIIPTDDNMDSDIKSVTLEDSKRVGLKPDTIAYSSAISVCVGSKQWGQALVLLERMEELNIQRNVVTYNTVIEALSNAGETARAELVYQSALRTGVYNHWHRSSQHHSTQRDRQRLNTDSRAGLSEVMDLHNFPLAVAKAALMLVLGEMCTGSIAVADPLILITGRGNHANLDGQRGVLRRELFDFCSNLGLELHGSQLLGKKNPTNRNDKARNAPGSSSNSDSGNISDDFHTQTSNNPGRLWLTKASTEKWLEEQRKEHEVLRCSGTKGVHGNMFLKVAMAKRKLTQIESEVALNVRAVCPFSSATHRESSAELSEFGSGSKVVLVACPAPVPASAEGTGGASTILKKCPAHSSTSTSTVSDVAPMLLLEGEQSVRTLI